MLLLAYHYKVFFEWTCHSKEGVVYNFYLYCSNSLYLMVMSLISNKFAFVLSYILFIFIINSPLLIDLGYYFDFMDSSSGGDHGNSPGNPGGGNSPEGSPNPGKGKGIMLDDGKSHEPEKDPQSIFKDKGKGIMVDEGKGKEPEILSQAVWKGKGKETEITVSQAVWKGKGKEIEVYTTPEPLHSSYIPGVGFSTHVSQPEHFYVPDVGPSTYVPQPIPFGYIPDIGPSTFAGVDFSTANPHVGPSTEIPHAGPSTEITQTEPSQETPTQEAPKETPKFKLKNEGKALQKVQSEIWSNRKVGLGDPNQSMILANKVLLSLDVDIANAIKGFVNNRDYNNSIINTDPIINVEEVKNDPAQRACRNDAYILEFSEKFLRQAKNATNMRNYEFNHALADKLQQERLKIIEIYHSQPIELSFGAMSISDTPQVNVPEPSNPNIGSTEASSSDPTSTQGSTKRPKH